MAMLRRANPTSSAKTAPASTTDAGCSRVLATGQRSGEEGEDQGENLVRSLHVRVVTGAVDHDELADTGGQVGDDLLALRAGVGPVGVEAAFDDEHRGGDVGELLAGVGGLRLAHVLEDLH